MAFTGPLACPFIPEKFPPLQPLPKIKTVFLCEGRGLHKVLAMSATANLLEWAIQQRFDVPEDNILIAILLDPRTFLSARTILGEELSKKANKLLSEAINNEVLAQVRSEDETSCTEDTGDSVTSSRREQAVTPNVIGLHPILSANMVSDSIATGTVVMLTSECRGFSKKCKK